MPELKELFSGILDGAVQAIEESERAHLIDQVRAVSQAGGGDLKSVLEAFSSGWLPDYFAADELTVSAQLAMSTLRTRQLQTGGGVSFGPVQVTATFSEGLQQGTNTNLTVTATLARQSRNRALANAFEALSAAPLAAPAPTPAAPATTTLSVAPVAPTAHG